MLKRNLVRSAQCRGRESVVLCNRRVPETFASPSKQLVGAGSHNYKTIVATKRLIRGVPWMCRAKLGRIASGSKILARLQSGDRKRSSHHGNIDVNPAPT